MKPDDRQMAALSFIAYTGYELKTPPPDLTQIKANSGKVFPFSDMYAVIDGRRMNRAHGRTEMPVWGSAFKLVLPVENQN